MSLRELCDRVVPYALVIGLPGNEAKGDGGWSIAGIRSNDCFSVIETTCEVHDDCEENTQIQHARWIEEPWVGQLVQEMCDQGKSVVSFSRLYTVEGGDAKLTGDRSADLLHWR